MEYWGLPGSGEGLVAGNSKLSEEPSGYVEWGYLIEQFSNYWVQKRESASWS